MAKPTVYIPDDLLASAVAQHAVDTGSELDKIKTSEVVQYGLMALVQGKGRPATSERGRLETLAAVRTARQALDELERTLVHQAPVKRRTRRRR